MKKLVQINRKKTDFLITHWYSIAIYQLFAYIYETPVISGDNIDLFASTSDVIKLFEQEIRFAGIVFYRNINLQTVS